jgi:hypothetical protein
MIITQLKGGLGNQLFQYALGRSLAQKYNVPLRLDTSWFGIVPNRQYDLGNFAISGTVATPEEIDQVKGSLITRLADRMKPYYRRTSITEQAFQFDPHILSAGPNTYLDGYWQSEKYFKDIAPLIRNEFTVTAQPTGKNKELLQQIQETTAVSLHVRRGDYVANKSFNNFHGTSPIEYYEAAVAHIASKVKKPHFYIFSDDPSWTKEHLIFDYPMTFVTGNDKAAQEDLRLMSNCQHFIVANSTFSWWGAWLASSPKKSIIAPKVWFKAKPNDEIDLIPKDWIRL